MSESYEHNIYNQASKNVRRTWYIIVVFIMVVLAIGYIFGVLYDNVFIVVVSVIFAVGSSASSFWFSEKIALNTAGAYKADRANSSHLRLIRTVENMSIVAGIPTPGVYIIDDPAPNAFATGRSPEHASVAFTTGILDLLYDDELEGVVAHEISHIRNRDILVGTIVVILIGFIAIVAELAVRFGQSIDHRENKTGRIIFVFALVLTVLTPFFGQLIQATVSRKREFLADADGALITRYPEGLAVALLKINSQGQAMKHSSQAINHLFIASPLGRLSLLQRVIPWFRTHPPVKSRVNELVGEQMGQELLARYDRTNTDA